jgi:hypothetical protein
VLLPPQAAIRTGSSRREAMKRSFRMGRKPA